MPARRSPPPLPLTALVLLAAAGLAACHSSDDSKDKAYQVLKGEEIFKQRCALCHSTTDQSGQGPGLGGVVGRKAASLSNFSYSPALKKSGLTWDNLALNRFLAAPTEMVPGTTMPLSVPDDTERHELIAYLSTLHGGHAQAQTPAPTEEGPSPDTTPGLRTGKAAFGDYRSDAPGVRRHITVADLPAPFATPSASNPPRVVPRPPDARLKVPPGFTAELFANDLSNIRLLRTAPNGDIFVSQSSAGRVLVLRAKDGATRPELTEVFAKDLDRPFGIAFYPPSPEPRWVYVANSNSVVRFPYQSGDLHARGAAESIVPKLAETNGGHWTRDVAFSRDGKQMFVSVGSESNNAESMPPQPPEGLQAWNTTHPLGAAWGSEDHRADVLVFDPEGRNGRIFATGIRNCVGEAVNPLTGDLWCSTNERDGLGDNLVPDYITRIRDGAFYGWPWYYLGDHQDPRKKDQRPDLAGKVTVPDVLLQAHSASLEMTFYEGSMFPAEYRGNAFAALHGSWNRSLRTGYKVVRVPLEKGVPTGEYEDFLTGFVIDRDHVWGRPVGVTVAHDGALLVTEDGNGTIWRVAWTGEPKR